MTGVSGCRITYFPNDSCYRHRLAQVGAAGSAGVGRAPRCPELPSLVFLLPMPTLRQSRGKEQGAVSRLCGVICRASQVCCVPTPGHQPHSSGWKLPSQLDSYHPHHLLEERTGTPLTARIGHLEASPRAILEFACDIHCSPQQGRLSEDLGGLNLHDCFRLLHLWCLFSLFKNSFLGAYTMAFNR